MKNTRGNNVLYHTVDHLAEQRFNGEEVPILLGQNGLTSDSFHSRRLAQLGFGRARVFLWSQQPPGTVVLELWVLSLDKREVGAIFGMIGHAGSSCGAGDSAPSPEACSRQSPLDTRYKGGIFVDEYPSGRFRHDPTVSPSPIFSYEGFDPPPR